MGLLRDKLKVRDDHAQSDSLIKDNWIYIQEPDVKLGRLQIFNNWSPYMVADRSKCGSGWNTFVMKVTRCGRCPTRNWSASEPGNWR